MGICVSAPIDVEAFIVSTMDNPRCCFHCGATERLALIYRPWAPEHGQRICGSCIIGSLVQRQASHPR